jgi:hypothetical protein
MTGPSLLDVVLEDAARMRGARQGKQTAEACQ